MNVQHPCEYCGTPLDEDGQEESNIPAAGPRHTHFSAACRDRVHAALQSYKRELSEVVNAAIPITCREPWCISGAGLECGACDACTFQRVMQKYKPRWP